MTPNVYPHPCRYPCVEAGDVAVRAWLLEHPQAVDRVVFVTRTARNEEVYSKLMLAYFPLN